jgi:hypothetical protein
VKALVHTKVIWLPLLAPKLVRADECNGERLSENGVLSAVFKRLPVWL